MRLDKILHYLGFKFNHNSIISSGQISEIYQKDENYVIMVDNEFYEYKKFIDYNKFEDLQATGLISFTYYEFYEDYSDLIRDYKINQIL